MTRLNIKRIEDAAKHIDAVFQNTPQYLCPHLSKALGCGVVLKVETLNPVRCFKGRGTETVLANLKATNGPKSVVCASAGNLGQALAYCGSNRGFDVTVTVSSTANPLKIERMKALGATVVLVEGQIEEALNVAIEHSQKTGAFLVEDSKNIDTCEGAGTIGLELANLPISLDSVLISLGAGAMATGIGFALKSRHPDTRVLCVQPQNAPALSRSYLAGEVVDSGPPNTIADGVAGRYTIPDVLTDMLEIVDDALLVKEDSIIEGMRLLYECSGLVVEPAAALGVACILENPDRFRGQTIATVLCGANVAPRDFENWVINRE
ncbi:threonine/serine dehydratase [Puniceibacterium sp. IMCC21224]|jgi:threonine dehydratase|uniref:threonine ammonia-lyase n=1 Tax=Puniceibacterium sp. IMCC21224 TaxID=1618204 RepID=UPI00064DA1A1|nr:pyridoxal-phosphate dependent enzyme [Puniceibacterium sp. IMCC21224]KMK64656.1 threonine dehydratase [Puniceibacterium sp. IMCC21224]